MEEEIKRKISINPKLLSNIGIIIIFLVLCYFGIKSSTNFTTQEKTTKLGLEDVGELVTQTCYTTVIEDSKVNRDFFKLFDIPFTESRQIFSYDFEIDAAVNFDKIKIKKTNNNKKIIELELPHAKVYKTTLKPDSLKVYLDSESLFSRIDLENHNKALTKMEDQAKNDCIANKMLDSADANAQRLINSMVKGNNNYKEYTIEYKYKGGK